MADPDPDPDHVQVLAAQFHQLLCVPGSKPNAKFSAGDRDLHEKQARKFLTGYANAGYHLTSKEG